MTDVFNNFLKKGIIKSDVFDHFPVFFSIRLTKDKLQEGVIKIKKKIFNKRNITTCKEQLSLLCWRHIDFSGTMNEIYDTLLKTLIDIYEANFPICKYILKDKDIKSPWISKGLKNPQRQNKGYTSNFLRLRHLKMNLSTKTTKIYSKN